MLFRSKSHQENPPSLLLVENDEPIRGPMFSLERLEQHAESLAQAQLITVNPRKGKPIVPRLLENQQNLLLAYI